jgi:hypothetical protein
MNKTNVSFSEEEENLLHKGLKYNLHQKPKTWINTLAFEAETAVTLLPIQHQDPVRYQIKCNIEQLIKQQELTTDNPYMLLQQNENSPTNKSKTNR